jgi:hypothetical protein
VLDQISEHGVGKAVFIGPLGIAEDAEEFVGVGCFDRAHRLLQNPAYIAASLSDFSPMGIRRNLETMVLGEQGEVFIATGITQSGDGFFVVDITKTFVEQQREDELLVVSRVNGTAQEDCRSP